MIPDNTIPLRPVNIVRLKMVKDRKAGYNHPINHSQDVINLVRSYFKDSYREMVLVIGVDTANRPTVIHTVATGSPSQAAVSIGSVFKPLMLSNSSAFILVHNHPSDGLTPSSADRELTEKLKTISKSLEITMLDHLILNGDGSGFYSFKSQGTL